jgi:hypothetical protein
MNAFTRIPGTSILISLGVLLLTTAISQGAAVVYQATGTRPEDLRPIMDEFKRDVLFGIGNRALPSEWTPGSFAEATFDDLSVGSLSSNRFSLESGGVPLIAVAGNKMLVSADTTNLAGGNLLFGDINPQYAETFQAFSSPSVLSIGLPPGLISIQRPPNANAFGAVFSDVDFEGTAKFEGVFESSSIPVGSQLQFSFNIPATPGQRNLSFFGVIFDGNETLNLLAVRLPGLPEQSDLPSESQLRDFIAVDNLIIGRSAVPEPSTLALTGIGGIIWSLLMIRKRRVKQS